MAWAAAFLAAGQKYPRMLLDIEAIEYWFRAAIAQGAVAGQKRSP